MSYLHDMELQVELPLKFVEVLEVPAGWVFSYNATAYVDDGEINCALVGNAPLIVDRYSEQVHVFGTAHPVAYYVDEYQKKGS
ncbi:hypothetical protein FNU76_05760 [Chitinimonas arctica]|uniref:Immunity protein 35 domain-containing protein n=1 Tax=Chitinimonas arctica TaxID=2594795 RepID=A0A516SCL5_9NEIS|nr:YrhB domain-containing protein [Chitinimonas arctica]QDQ25895.1 hypothetical protein FNU76_05760 [Chitinimonas arctica]